jgi:hypothetical protein
MGLSLAGNGTVTGFDPVASGFGKVLQVVSATKTDTFSSTTQLPTFADVPGLSVTLTPASADSQFLVMVSLALSGAAITTGSAGALVENSTVIGGTAAGSRPSATFYLNRSDNVRDGSAPLNFITLRSPATADPITYKVVVGTQSSAAAVTVNVSGDDGDSGARPRLASSITVVEVVG